MSRLDNIGKQFFDGNGEPLAGGRLYFYETGTTTLATTFSDSAESSANANPVILDAEGRMPDVFYPGFLKIVLRDSDDVLVETRDPVGFSATVTGIPTGGTDGQVLTKQSSTDGDVDWEDASGGGGGGFTSYSIVSANTTCVAGTYYILDSSSESRIEFTLPSSPSVGDVVGIQRFSADLQPKVLQNGSNYREASGPPPESGGWQVYDPAPSGMYPEAVELAYVGGTIGWINTYGRLVEIPA